MRKELSCFDMIIYDYFNYWITSFCMKQSPKTSRLSNMYRFFVYECQKSSKVKRVVNVICAYFD